MKYETEGVGPGWKAAWQQIHIFRVGVVSNCPQTPSNPDHPKYSSPPSTAQASVS